MTHSDNALFSDVMTLVLTILLVPTFPFPINYSCSANKLEGLDEVFKSYDKNERPNTAPIALKLQVDFFALGPISTKTFTMDTNFYLREWWTDPRINLKNRSDIKRSGNPSSFLWVPDIFIYNSRGADINKMLTDTTFTQVSSNGKIFLSAGIKASTTCNMNLQMYPMDSQVCSILLGSYSLSVEELHLVWHEQPILYDEKSMKILGFTISDITTGANNKTYPTGTYTILKMSFHVDRTFSYYLFRTYIPSIFLVILTWGIFQIPATAYPARITLIMTSFLANTFILQGASSEYAKVEYTTAIELFLQVNITFIMIAMLEYMTVIQTNPDITFLWCQPSKCNEVVVKMKAMGIKNENFMECYANNFENPDHKIVSKSIQKMEDVEKSVSVPNLHNIDRIGPILIPIMYTLFNIAYFAYFLL